MVLWYYTEVSSMDPNSDIIEPIPPREDYAVQFLRKLVHDAGAHWSGIQLELLDSDLSALVFINPITGRHLSVPFDHRGFDGGKLFEAVNDKLAADTRGHELIRSAVKRAKLREIADSLSALASELRDIYDGRSK